MRKKVLLILLLLAVVGVSYGGYRIYQRTFAQSPDAAAETEKEIAEVVQKVGVLTELPTDQIPVLATVTEKEKLVAQPFFARAENGDKVLFYTALGRAILYRPSTNKIIDMTVIAVNEPPTTAVPESPEPTPQVYRPQVKLLNGTEIPGLTTVFEKKLVTLISQFEVTDKTNAAVKTYEKTRVIDVTKKATVAAQQIADTFAVKVESTLPAEESAGAADIVVILGTDAK